MPLPGRKTWWLSATIVAPSLTALGLWLGPTSTRPLDADPGDSAAGPAARLENAADDAMRVATVKPTAGGLPRTAVLPCSAHWYESAELYSKVSGYLASQEVDIGQRVTKGQVIARIDVPELERDVELADAAHHQAIAEAEQVAARQKATEADYRVAKSNETRARADLDRWEAERAFRQKEHARFRELSRSDSVQSAIVDEKLYQLQAVEAGQRAAESAVQTAREQIQAAEARVELAEADTRASEAKVRVAAAQLAKAKLLASFAEITSPYDGVVVARNFHRGDFVRAAEQSDGTPLFAIARTDLIRVVAHIPDRDVPFAHEGDAVTIELDALPGTVFKAKLSRTSLAENAETRTMRAEVDLDNEAGRIVGQMYGRMEVQLEAPSQELTLPSACLVGDVRDGKASVFVIEEGVATLRSVRVHADNGVNVEVVDGLAPTDDLVVRPPPGLTDGTAVSPTSE